MCCLYSIKPGAVEDHIKRVINEEKIIAATAAHGVSTGTAIEGVVTGTAIEGVGTLFTEQLIFAHKADQNVITITGIDGIHAQIAIDGISAGRSINLLIENWFKQLRVGTGDRRHSLIAINHIKTTHSIRSL